MSDSSHNDFWVTLLHQVLPTAPVDNPRYEIAAAIIDPHRLTHQQAVDAAARAMDIDHCFDADLLILIEERWHGIENCPQEEVLRTLDVIDAISPTGQMVMPLLELIAHSDPIVRSKAVGILGKISANLAWMNEMLTDDDPRVRANLIEAVSERSDLNHRQLIRMLQRAATNQHHRVSTTALRQLAKFGDLASYEKLLEMERDGTPEYRRAAAWALRSLHRPNREENEAYSALLERLQVASLTR